MKKIIFLFMMLPFALKAQGDLQFNQIIFFDIPYGTPQSFTVPTGKVWKIESVGSSGFGCIVWLQNSAAQNLGNLYSGSGNESALPVWLPSGYSGIFSYTEFSCSGTNAYVSILEFNVVP